MTDNNITEQLQHEYVAALYQVLLGREPDPEGLKGWLLEFERRGAQGFRALLDQFGSSDEFNKRLQGDGLQGDGLEAAHAFNFSNVDDDTILRLNDKTSRYWRETASTANKLYWSVLTDPSYRGQLSAAEKLKFLKTGANDVERISRICDQFGHELKSCQNYLEYGCGVGRTAYNLPPEIENIYCVDFSPTHLQEAAANLGSGGGSRFRFMPINSPMEICNLPGNQDLIHSVIVLQHNTPPVIEYTLIELLRRLREGGLAILHIPIAKTNYHFDIAEYLSSDTAGSSMEMHILPKANIHKASELCECDLIYSFCEGGCGYGAYSEFMVFRRRPSP